MSSSSVEWSNVTLSSVAIISWQSFVRSRATYKFIYVGSYWSGDWSSNWRSYCQWKLDFVIIMNALAFLGPLFLLFLRTLFLTISFSVSAYSTNRPYSTPWRTSGNDTDIGDTRGMIAAGPEPQQQRWAFVDSFVIHSDIRFRYSRTKSTCRIVNPSFFRSPQVNFNLMIPETAFISKFAV